MAKGKLPLIGLAAATITLSACVVKVWEVKYPRLEGGYTGAHDVTLTSNNEPVILGFANHGENSGRSLLVAKYDSRGNKLWDYPVPELQHSNFPGGNRFITTDSDNSVYFSGFRFEDRITVTKLTPEGSLAWESNIPIDISIPTDIRAIGNDMVLLMEGIIDGYNVHAYNGAGEPLWIYSTVESCNETDCPSGELDEYEDPVRTNDNITPPPFFVSGELTVLNGGDVFINSGVRITRLNQSGQKTLSVSAESLGVSSFVDMADNGDYLALLGVEGDSLRVLVLNTNLEVFQQYEPATPSTAGGLLDINQENLICLAAIDGASLHVEGIGPLTWVRQVEAEISFEVLSGLSLSEDGKCHVSTAEQREAEQRSDGTAGINPVSNTTRIYNTGGELSDNFNIPHFLSFSTRIQSNNIYSAGQSADYIDGDYPLETNVATLFKHQVR